MLKSLNQAQKSVEHGFSDFNYYLEAFGWRILEVIYIFLYLSFCIIFAIASNYNDRVEQKLPDTVLMLDFIVALVILVLHITRTYLDRKQWKLRSQTYSLLIYLSVIGPIIVYISNRIDSNNFSQTYMRAGNLAYIYPIRFFCLQRAIASGLAPKENSLIVLSRVKRKVIALINIIITTLLTVSSTLQVILNITFFSNPDNNEGSGENGGQSFLSFFNAFFFASVSITNGPESDIVPDSVVTRLVVLFIVVMGIIYIPSSFSELFDLMKQRPKYKTYFNPLKDQNHVIMAGKIQLGSTYEFLKEFISDEHETLSNRTVLVILNPAPPDHDLENLLNRPEYKDRVNYVIGSGNSLASLNRVHAGDADAFFIFTSFKDSEIAEDDENDSVQLLTNLQSFMMTRFNFTNKWNDIRVFVRLETPEYPMNFNVFATRYAYLDMCRMSFISHNCLVPGFSTLIHMLVTSVSQNKKHRLRHLLPSSPDWDIWWDHGYINSCCHQIYMVEIPELWAGRSFSDLACCLYLKFGAILLGLGKRAPHSATEFSQRNDLYNIFINPTHYLIDRSVTDLAFIITVSEEKVEKIIDLDDPADLEFHYDDDPSPTTNTSTSTQVGNDPTGKDPEKTLFSHSNPFIPTGDSPLSFSKAASYSSVLLMNNNEQTHPQKHVRIAAPERSSPTQIPPPTSPDNERVTRTLSPSLSFPPDGSSRSLPPVVLRRSKTVSSRVGTNIQLSFLKEDDPDTSFNDSFTLRATSSRRDATTQTEPTGIEVIPLSKHQDHILVCHNGSTFPNRFDYFVHYIRARGVYVDIVFLGPSSPNPQQEELLSQYQQLYFTQGSPQSYRELYQAGIREAVKVIVLSSPDARNTQSIFSAITTIEVLFQDTILNKVISDFYSDEELEFLLENEALSSSHLEALDVLQRKVMTGQMISLNMLDNLLCQTYFRPYMIDVVANIAFSSHQELSLEESQKNLCKSHTYIIEIPNFMNGKRYFELFKYLLCRKSSLPLGLYRHDTQRQMWYVLGFPRRQTILRPTDHVYIMAQSQPTFP